MPRLSAKPVTPPTGFQPRSQGRGEGE